MGSCQRDVVIRQFLDLRDVLSVGEGIERKEGGTNLKSFDGSHGEDQTAIMSLFL